MSEVWAKKHRRPPGPPTSIRCCDICMLARSVKKSYVRTRPRPILHRVGYGTSEISRLAFFGRDEFYEPWLGLPQVCGVGASTVH